MSPSLRIKVPHLSNQRAIAYHMKLYSCTNEEIQLVLATTTLIVLRPLEFFKKTPL
jgi:hypothetical protein